MVDVIVGVEVVMSFWKIIGGEDGDEQKKPDVPAAPEVQSVPVSAESTSKLEPVTAPG